jgi:hypothetical protein
VVVVAVHHLIVPPGALTLVAPPRTGE